MSTLLVTVDFPPAYTGGIASWAEDLALALHRSGEAVTVLAKATGDTRAEDSGRPYPVRRMRGRSWGSWQGLWALVAGAGTLISTDKISTDNHVLFATWPLATLLGPAARSAGAEVCIAFHGSDLTRLARPSADLRRAINSATALLPVSAFLATELRRLGAPMERVHTLPMPLDLSVARCPPGQALLCVARLTPLKGVDRAIRLADRLGRPLVVVGEGPARAQLEEAARGTATTFLGRLGRAEIQALPAAAALLLPRADVDGSGAEGLGLTLIEAAARGLPSVGCFTGGVPEAVGGGVILRHPDDPDEADLDAVRTLLADPTAPARALAWVRSHHGPDACLRALRAASTPRGGS